MEIPRGAAVLVLGGGGFLGSFLIRSLVHLQPQCRIYSSSRSPQSHPDRQSSVTYIACDIRSSVQVSALFQDIKPVVVFHCASPGPLETSQSQHEVNIQGTNNLLLAAAKCSATRAFIYSGSDSGLVPNQEPISEEDAILYNHHNFENPYGKTKGIAEALVTAANGQDILTVTLRIPGLYGPYEDKDLLPALLKTIKDRRTHIQIGDDTRLFEVLHVSKAAEAHVLAAKALLAQDARALGASLVAGEAIFVSDGMPTPYWTFFRRCFIAGGADVGARRIKRIPLAVAQIMASTIEWLYFIFTCGYKKPSMRRQNMDHFARGCNWKLQKAVTRLGYVPVTKEQQDNLIEEMMVWGRANIRL